MLALALLLLAAETASSSLSFALRVQGEKELRATISGPEADLAAGAFRGSVSLNGSPSELPVAGTVLTPTAAGRCRSP
jgi:hypothetical protein